MKKGTHTATILRLLTKHLQAPVDSETLSTALPILTDELAAYVAEQCKKFHAGKTEGTMRELERAVNSLRKIREAIV